MRDVSFFAVMILAAAALVGLAMVWPQGLGDRSPGPFGSLPVQQRPEVQAKMKRQTDQAQMRAREAIGELQSRAVEAAK
jgi:hypothetical protein